MINLSVLYTRGVCRRWYVGEGGATPPHLVSRRTTVPATSLPMTPVRPVYPPVGPTGRRREGYRTSDDRTSTDVGRCDVQQYQSGRKRPVPLAAVPGPSTIEVSSRRIVSLRPPARGGPRGVHSLVPSRVTTPDPTWSGGKTQVQRREGAKDTWWAHRGHEKS